MIYQHVAGLKPRKHYFPITKGHATTCEVGEILPVYKNELVPGDRVKLEVSSIVRTMPLATPCLQKIYVKLWAFFVPYRVLDEEFKEFYTGGEQGKNAYSLPFYHPNPSTTPLSPYRFSKYSLGDEFGFPIGVDFGGVNDPNFRGAPIGYLWYAYNKIWNEYFRDEWRDGERLPIDNTLAHLRYKKDYFTSALPSPQRGNGGAFSWDLASALSRASAVWDHNIPLSFSSDRGVIGTGNAIDGTADAKGIISLDSQARFEPIGASSWGFGNSTTSSDFPWVFQTGEHSPVQYNQLAYVPKDSSYVNQLEYSNPTPYRYIYSASGKVYKFDGLNDNRITAPSSARFGFDIADLRLQVQMQKYEERCQRTGYRFNEYILAHFGQHTSDKTLDRAQFIGYAKSSINISEIPQTSASIDGSFQGNLSGRGLGTIAVNLGTYRAEEPGVIFVLQALVPHTSYASQGVNKMWTKRNRFDFYLPEFAHLSEQAVFKRELFYTGDVAQDEAVFGFQGIYDEYRSSYDEVCGDFRDTLKNWKMAREFANQPELNSAFLDVDGTASYNMNPFFYQGSDYKHYIIDTATTMHSVRPIPLIAEPGLVDHF